MDVHLLRADVNLSRRCGPGKASIMNFIPLVSLALLLVLPGSGDAATLRATWNSADVYAGSVVSILVEAPVSLVRTEAVAGGERFPLLPLGKGRYLALAGVDLKWDREFIPVDLELFPNKTGKPYRLRANLKLKGHTFRKQELSLPVEMVDLSKENLGRVRTDNISIKDVSSNRIQKRHWSKPFMLPVKGRISTYFGTSRMMNNKPRSPHSGLDIAAGRGKKIAASNKGVVTLARNMLLTGNTVMVDHGWGVYTLYAHLEGVFVKEGQVLARGEELGSVGSTGRATGPHLHFGAFIRGAKVDPLKLIKATAVLDEESEVRRQK